MRKSFLAGALALVLSISMMSGCSLVKNNAYVATVNGEKISKAEYMYYLEIAKQTIMQQAGATEEEKFWETTEFEGKNAGEAAKEKALDECVQTTVIVQKAKENGVELTSEIKASVEQQKNSLGSQYETTLENLGLTDEGFTTAMQKNGVAQEYLQKLQSEAQTYTEEEKKEYYDNNMMRAKHILIPFQDPNTQQNLDAVTVKNQADEVLAKVNAGEDFDALIAQYSQDPGQQTNPDGYIFGPNEMVKEFEDATKALEIGQTSGLVKTSYGYHIIKREPLPTYEEYIASSETASSELESKMLNNKLTEQIKQWKDEATVEPNEEELNGIKVE